MNVKGDLNLEIDTQGIEVRITITPDENGADLSPESLLAILTERGVKEGLDTEAIDKAFRMLLRKKGEPATFVAAAGTPPRLQEPEVVEYMKLPVPPRLEKAAREVLASAPRPRAWRTREERVRREKPVPRKPGLRFLHAREEVAVVFEKRTVREEVAVDPSVRETGFAAAGAVVARVKAGKQGREGRSVFGKPVHATRPAQEGFLLGEGLARDGEEVRASAAGFLRRGANWCDIVPFRDHLVELASSADGLTCMLTFTPGDPRAPVPGASEIAARAGALGFGEQSLLPAARIDALLAASVVRKEPLGPVSLTPAQDGIVSVTVSPDGLLATLEMHKARGGGNPLTLAAISEAIKASGVRGYGAETVRKDILAFFKGPQSDLPDYALARGRPARPGRDAAMEWLVEFLPSDEATRIRALSAAQASHLAGIGSLSEFPLERVEAVARVSTALGVLRIVPPTQGTPGVDVRGAAIPAPHGVEPAVRLFEGLATQGNTIAATVSGILEKGSDAMTVLLRARPHRDAELRVTVSPDRLRGLLSFSPAEGAGARIPVAEVGPRIEQAGITRGIQQDRILEAMDAMGRGSAVNELPIAEGRPPDAAGEGRIVFHAHLATGSTVTMREDGRADFRAQDRISRVVKGEQIASMRPPGVTPADGWDVTGAVIPARTEKEEALEAGKGVRADVDADGSVRFFAEADGEFIREGAVLIVREVHEIAGDVDMSTGNVDFPGTVRVRGSVRAGFTLSAGGDLFVVEGVEAAVVSAAGSISIGRGVKGEGKAVLRAKKGIVSSFAEHAVLLAEGDIRLRDACVRCQVKCGGKFTLSTERGSLVGGAVHARQGVSVQNLGSPGGARTEVSFGQDYLVKDQIVRVEREVAELAKKVPVLDAEMKMLARQPEPGVALAKARVEKLKTLKFIEQLKLRLISLRDTFDEHVRSEVEVRGTLYPGAVVESHGRHYTTTAEKRMITLYFDPSEGKILEKL